MATEIKLPSLGEGVDSADVLEILVREGETVEKDQGLLELETDKATVTVPSPSSGKVIKISVKEGDTVSVGGIILLMETSGTPAPQPPTAPAPTAPAPTAPAASAPAASAPAASAPAASAPAASAPAASAPATKPAAEVVPPKPIVAQSPQTVQSNVVPVGPRPLPPVSTPVSTSSVTPASSVPAASVPIAFPANENGSNEVIPAGPAIRRFAREVGVDLASIVGSGDGGRITRDDVLAVVRQANQTARSVPTSNPTPSVATNVVASSGLKSKEGLPGTAGSDDYGPIRVERMSKIRKTIAAQMHKSWTSVPRVTNFDDADVTELENFRQSSKDDYAARGIKLTTMPFLIKAVATALRHHPSMNATLDVENDQIMYKDYVNIGIAVDTDRGLVVPTLKHVDRMSIPDVAQSLGDLSARVRNNDFGVNDLRGGTFTISNLGAIGGTYSTPIVNVPEVAILLIGRTRKMPIVMDNDEIRARLMMPLSLAYDHRLVDGGTAARFLNDVIAYLEAPSRLLLAI